MDPQLRSSDAGSDKAIGPVTFGPFRFDLGDRVLYRDQTEVALPPRARDTLACLLENPGKVVSKDALISAVWQGSFVSDTALKEAVFLIRRELGDDPQHPSYIQTVHRRGYRFVATVTPESRGDERRVVPVNRRPIAALGGLLAAVLLGLALLWTIDRPTPAPPSPVVRAALEVPGTERLSPVGLAVSADGHQVVYLAKDNDRRLFRRSIDQDKSTVLDGTEGARRPFFSPDGRWLAFFAKGRLLTIPSAGGKPRDLAAAPLALGGAWTADGTLIFSGGPDKGLLQLAATGGEPRPLTQPDRDAGEVGHRWPALLPGHRALLYTVWRGSFEHAQIALLDLRSGESTPLVEGGSDPRFMEPGLLLYGRPGQVMAIAFDPERRRIRGAAVPVLEQIEMSDSLGAMELATTHAGLAVYTPIAEEAESHLEWSDFSGRRAPVLVDPGRYSNFALSPDGRRVALMSIKQEKSDIWIADLNDGALTRLTFDGRSGFPVWAPDNEHVFYSTAHGDRTMRIMSKAIDGHREPMQLVAPDALCMPRNLSADGTRLLYLQQKSDRTGWALHIAAVDGSSDASRRVESTESLRNGRLSPNAAWVAYESRAADAWEIYVRSASEQAGLWQISVGGGSAPRWSADGRQLYYRSGDHLMAVTVDGDGTSFRAGEPNAVVDLGDAIAYDLSAEQDRMLLLRPSDEPSPRHLNLILGWSTHIEHALRADPTD